jgi:formate dehydrogenase major subunit
MGISRRTFLKASAVAGAATAFGGLGFSLKPAAAVAAEFKLKGAKQTTSVCCYCSVGCGLIVSTDAATNRAVNIEGDPDHPTSEGSLCAKGASIYQLTENDKRITKPLYRAPNSDKWEEKSWDWMLDKVARKIKDVRDATFVQKNFAGQEVNRTEGIASIGSAALDNEECYLYQHMLRSLGLVYIEHQARI